MFFDVDEEKILVQTWSGLREFFVHARWTQFGPLFLLASPEQMLLSFLLLSVILAH